MNTILEPRQFRLLEGLRLNPRKSFSGRVRGERLTQKKGLSIEFADYRDYAEGDDLRHLDWNVLARLDTPIMKTYRDEEDLAVHLLVDASSSMNFGEPTKAASARNLACALGYICLASGDAVYPRRIGKKEPFRPALRGRSGYVRLASWASELDPEDSSSLSSSLKLFAGGRARAGVAVLLSDCLDPEVPAALRALGGRGHEVWVIQILSDIELDPDLEGDLRLLDSESGDPVEITANSYALREYRRRLEQHNDALRESLLRIGGRYALVRPDQRLDQVLKNTFKKEGWVV